MKSRGCTLTSRTLLIFATLYWVIWQSNPDAFVINEELNLTPIEDLHDLAFAEKPPPEAR